MDAWRLRLNTGLNPHLRSIFSLKYNPAPPIESKLGKRYGFPQHPYSEDFTLEQYNNVANALGSKPLTLNKYAKGDPIKGYTAGDLVDAIY